jgi:transposase
MNAVRIPQGPGRPRVRPLRLAGDKGYSYPRIRDWLRSHAIQAVIPQREDQLLHHRGRPLQFDRQAYRRRNVIECCVGWLKECRAVATRFEKTAVNFLAIVQLAIIQRYLRILDSSDRT